VAGARLFGRFELDLGAGPVAVGSARGESLLAHLLLNPGAHDRGRLAGLLWPDSTDAQARTNLRHLLHTVRGRLGPADPLDTTPRTISWRPAAWLDVAEFERLLDADPDVATLRAAVALHRGDLLAGADDEWLRAMGGPAVLWAG
jgi:DNA-binding SARP family transcriptional activator